MLKMKSDTDLYGRVNEIANLEMLKWNLSRIYGRVNEIANLEMLKWNLSRIYGRVNEIANLEMLKWNLSRIYGRVNKNHGGICHDVVRIVGSNTGTTPRWRVEFRFFFFCSFEIN